MSGIGGSLRAARTRLGWSRETLAHHSGLTWSAIAQIESGRRTEVRLGTLVQLADALGVSVDHLANPGAGPPSPLLEHRLLGYDSTDACVDEVARFIVEGADRAEPALVVTSPARSKPVRSSLPAGAEVEFANAAAWYRSPVHALNGYRDFVRRRLDAGATWIRLVGEPVWTGRSAAEVAAWTRYEALLNLALASYPVTLLCPYDRASLPASILADAHCTHPEVQSGGQATPSADYRQPEELLLS
jgi:transcriptional regulator with XRE-family HTH domain